MEEKTRLQLTHKFLSSFLGVLLALGVFVVVPESVQTQTVSELLAQVQALLAKVEELQLQLSNIEGEQSGVSAVPSVFGKTLRVGDRGPDVLALQKLLNTYPGTSVSETGAGSPGNETDFFGNKTKDAVIAFQNLFFNEVLRPVGLSKGTGVVGPSTRKKLNSFSGAIDLSDAITTVSLSKQLAEVGDFVTITGNGFDVAGNSIFFEGVEASSSHVITTVNDATDEIIFVVPELNRGEYLISVSSTKGRSNTLPLMILNDGELLPEIISVTPASGEDGTLITITGNNFSQSNNTVRTTFETYENVPAVGGKIRILIESSIPELNKPFLLPMDIPIFVFSDGKPSNQAIFTLTHHEEVPTEDKALFKQKLIETVNELSNTQ